MNMENEDVHNNKWKRHLSHRHDLRHASIFHVALKSFLALDTFKDEQKLYKTFDHNVMIHEKMFFLLKVEVYVLRIFSVFWKFDSDFITLW